MNWIAYDGMTFDEEQIVSGDIYEAVSLLNDALEIGTFQAELYITDETVGQKLMAFKRNAPLEYYEDNRKKGIWYIESIDRTGKFIYEIKANNAVALLEQSKHMGGIYTGQTVREIVADICTIPYIIKSNLLDLQLYGWLPAASRRENLSQVLFALGAVAKIDQSGTLRVEALWSGTIANFSEDRIFWGDKVKYESAVTEVSVLEHQYVAGTEELKLFEGTTQEKDTILFNEPMHSLTASGISILESGANYAVVSAGSGAVTGKRYTHTTREIKKHVSDADIANVIEVKNATLVSLVNSAGVAERLANYYAYVQTMENSVVYDKENAGDVSIFEHPYGGTAHGTIKSVEITLGNQKSVADTKTLIGFRPPQFQDGDYYDVREVITEDGEVIVPEGVYNMRAVIIGPGRGGWSGHKGGDTLENASKNTTDEYTDWTQTMIEEYASVGGDGGQPGEGGDGGKILVVDLEVSPNDVFKVKIGKGGIGGVFSADGSVLGSEGSATTFGEYTSDDGAASDAGYIDPVTGEIFASKGDSGIAGGKGGGGYEDGSAGGYVVGEAVTDRDGNVWQSGANPDSSDAIYDEASFYTPNEPYADELSGTVTAATNKGAGGGAAVGSNGHAGSAGSVSATSGSSSLNATVTVGPGGRGADATSPGKESRIGYGGIGGNGGGGAGGSGPGQITQRASKLYTPPNFNSKINGVLQSAGPGNGSNGGEGGDGGVILYYQKAVFAKAGAFMESKGRFFLDKSGRLVVV